MFQLRCEWALRHNIIPKNDSILNKVMQNVDQNVGQPGLYLCLQDIGVIDKITKGRRQ